MKSCVRWCMVASTTPSPPLTSNIFANIKPLVGLLPLALIGFFVCQSDMFCENWKCHKE